MYLYLFHFPKFRFPTTSIITWLQHLYKSGKTDAWLWMVEGVSRYVSKNTYAVRCMQKEKIRMTFFKAISIEVNRRWSSYEYTNFGEFIFSNVYMTFSSVDGRYTISVIVSRKCSTSINFIWKSKKLPTQ